MSTLASFPGPTQTRSKYRSLFEKSNEPGNEANINLLLYIVVTQGEFVSELYHLVGQVAAYQCT